MANFSTNYTLHGWCFPLFRLAYCHTIAVHYKDNKSWPNVKPCYNKIECDHNLHKSVYDMWNIKVYIPNRMLMNGYRPSLKIRYTFEMNMCLPRLNTLLIKLATCNVSFTICKKKKKWHFSFSNGRAEKLWI